MPGKVAVMDQIGTALDGEDGAYQDPHIEQFLLNHVDRRFVSYQAAVPLDALELHSSLRAQVRPATKDGVLPHLVERYVAMRQDGMKPPPAIVHDLHDGRYELLDARQRVEAAKICGATTIPAYVVTTDDTEVLWKIALRANEELNGEPPSDLDVELQILAYQREHPSISNVALAKMFRRTENQVSAVLTQARITERLSGLGFKTAATAPSEASSKAFTPPVIKRLASLRDDSVLRAAAELVRDARLSSTEAGAMVTEVNDLRSERDRLKLIAEKRENGLGPRIRKVTLGTTAPQDIHHIRDRLLRRSRVLAQDLAKYKTPGEAEMTNPDTAAELWSYIVSIEASGRRVVGPIIKAAR
jgi:ParB-like chromosome segregation protein Spo0J